MVAKSGLQKSGQPEDGTKEFKSFLSLFCSLDVVTLNSKFLPKSWDEIGKLVR